MQGHGGLGLGFRARGVSEDLGLQLSCKQWSLTCKRLNRNSAVGPSWGYLFMLGTHVHTLAAAPTLTSLHGSPQLRATHDALPKPQVLLQQWGQARFRVRV